MAKRECLRRNVGFTSEEGSSPIKLSFLTLARSDLAALLNLARGLNHHVDVSFIVSGAYFMGGSEPVESTITAIADVVGADNTHVAVCPSSRRTNRLAPVFDLGPFMEKVSEINPDVVCVHGDRWELLQFVSPIVASQIPIVHVGGGDETPKVTDHLVRNAVSKVASLHLVSSAQSAAVLSRMGEEDWRILISGELATSTGFGDQLDESSIRKNFQLEDSYGLVVLYPTPSEGLEALHELAQALIAVGGDYLVSTIVEEPLAEQFMSAWHEFSRHYPNIRVVDIPSRQDFLGLVKFAEVMIGNSSSGLTEAPSLGTPTVNIGVRQDGRAEGINVVNCGFHRDEIGRAIRDALKTEPLLLESNEIFRTPSPQAMEALFRRVEELLVSVDRLALLEKPNSFVTNSHDWYQ